MQPRIKKKTTNNGTGTPTSQSSAHPIFPFLNLDFTGSFMGLWFGPETGVSGVASEKYA